MEINRGGADYLNLSNFIESVLFARRAQRQRRPSPLSVAQSSLERGLGTCSRNKCSNDEDLECRKCRHSSVIGKFL